MPIMEKKKEGRARAGRVDGQRKGKVAQTLWGMLYADDAGIVSQSPEGLKQMMTVIVTACAAFGLTAKTEITCLQRKVESTSRSPLLQPARCANGRVCLGGAISADWDLRSVEVTRRIQRVWALSLIHI